MGLALFSFRGKRRNKTFLALLFFIFLLTVAAADMVYFHTLLNKNRRSAAPGAEEKKGKSSRNQAEKRELQGAERAPPGESAHRAPNHGRQEHFYISQFIFNRKALPALFFICRRGTALLQQASFSQINGIFSPRRSHDLTWAEKMRRRRKFPLCR